MEKTPYATIVAVTTKNITINNGVFLNSFSLDNTTNDLLGTVIEVFFTKKIGTSASAPTKGDYTVQIIIPEIFDEIYAGNQQTSSLALAFSVELGPMIDNTSYTPTQIQAWRRFCRPFTGYIPWTYTIQNALGETWDYLDYYDVVTFIRFERIVFSSPVVPRALTTNTITSGAIQKKRVRKNGKTKSN